jgi:hypothetical protein
MMNIDVKRPPSKLIETLRQRIAELEDMEASGAATLTHARCWSISKNCWIRLTG